MAQNKFGNKIVVTYIFKNLHIVNTYMIPTPLNEFGQKNKVGNTIVQWSSIAINFQNVTPFNVPPQTIITTTKYCGLKPGFNIFS